MFLSATAPLKASEWGIKMQRVLNFLKEAGTYYLATIDGDQARMCPFGTINEFEGKPYLFDSKHPRTLVQL